MITKLKKTAFGKMLYRLSRSPVGLPLRYVAKRVQINAAQAIHKSPENQKNNQEQAYILAQFEARTKDNG